MELVGDQNSQVRRVKDLVEKEATFSIVFEALGDGLRSVLVGRGGHLLRVSEENIQEGVCRVDACGDAGLPEGADDIVSGAALDGFPAE